MKACPNCGFQNGEDVNYCYKCGHLLSHSDGSENIQLRQFDRTFKWIGPMIISLLGLILLLLIIEILRSLASGSDLCDGFARFLEANLFILFGFMILTSYSSYTSRRFPKEHRLVAPLVAAIVIVFILWLLSNIFGIIGDVQGVQAMETLADLFKGILYIVFLLVLLIGYIGVLMNIDREGGLSHILDRRIEDHRTHATDAHQSYGGGYAQPLRTLKRSNRNKVLAGVCAGMAEYFDMDPFLVRAFWVIGALISFGAVLLAYLILAIVLPLGD